MMRVRKQLAPRRPVGLIVLSVLAAAPAFVALAVDPPHWTGAFPSESPTVDCTTPCHVTHNDQGGALTSDASNVNLCQSCHNSSNTLVGRPIDNAAKAVPGAGGTSHAFAVPAVNASLETQIPTNLAMAKRVMGGNIVCSTCHDQHDNSATFGGTAQIRQPKKRHHVSGTGVLSSGGAYTDTVGAWFAIKITTAGNEGSAKFQFQKYTDAGGWTPWSSDLNAGADVPLLDGVTVSFGAGSYAFDEHWEFSVAWPFLRAKLDEGSNASADAFCRDCHADWVWDPADVTTHTAGVKKGHPVGIGLGGGAFDRATPLDANGGVQGAGGDANPSNDYRLDAFGNLQCLSCHAMHYADSNSQTVDEP